MAKNKSNSPYRNEKFLSRISRALAEIINNDVTNANVKFITLSSIKISKDKNYITVFFTTIYNNNKKAEEGLNNASGFIASRLSSYIGLSPNLKLRFVFDSQTINAFKIDKLIENADK